MSTESTSEFAEVTMDISSWHEAALLGIRDQV